MKFTLAIIPTFFALSAFGSPIEPNARQKPACNFTQCISAISNQPAAIIPPCAGAIDNLIKIQQAENQGKPPSQADQINFIYDSLKCFDTSIAAGFAIPAACNGCPGVRN